MSLFTRQPTSNTTPDPGQGGSAVDTPSNTGHASTNAAAAFNGSQTKTCIWTGFAAAPAGPKVSTVLKFDWAQDGSFTDPGTNQFKTEISTNGGGSWTNIFTHANVNAPSNGSSQVTLADDQDLTQVRMRDSLNAAGHGDPAGAGSVTASVSNIQIEVTTQDARVIVIM